MTVDPKRAEKLAILREAILHARHEPLEVTQRKCAAALAAIKALGAVLVFCLIGCHSVDEKALAHTKREVEILGEQAKLNAPWSGVQLAMIDSEVAAIKLHFDQQVRGIQTEPK